MRFDGFDFQIIIVNVVFCFYNIVFNLIFSPVLKFLFFAGVEMTQAVFRLITKMPGIISNFQ